MAWLGGAVCVFAIAFLSQPSPASPSPPCRRKLIDQRDHVSELFVQAFDGQLLPNLLASSTSFRRFQYSRESFAAISRVCRCFSDSLSPAVEKLKHSANKSGDGGGKNADLQKKSVYLGIGHDYEFYWMRGAFSLVNMSPRATTL